MSLILFGFKSSGKTYFGKLLSEKLEKGFIDTDFLIEKLYESRDRKNLTCREIFQKRGEEFFRALESEVILSLPEKGEAIISLGGGALLDPNNYKKLKKIGKLVYIDTPREIIEQRVFADQIPAFLSPADTKGSYEEIYEKRTAFYETLDAIKVQTQGKTDLEVLNDLREACYGQ